jgi:hypothetical protein
MYSIPSHILFADLYVTAREERRLVAFENGAEGNISRGRDRGMKGFALSSAS